VVPPDTPFGNHWSRICDALPTPLYAFTAFSYFTYDIQKLVGAVPASYKCNHFPWQCAELTAQLCTVQWKTGRFHLCSVLFHFSMYACICHLPMGLYCRVFYLGFAVRSSSVDLGASYPVCLPYMVRICPLVTYLSAIEMPPITVRPCSSQMRMLILHCSLCLRRCAGGN
jgi:hypothetical protein